MRICCHPDDPPFPLLGLPRVMSTEADYRMVKYETYTVRLDPQGAVQADPLGGGVQWQVTRAATR